MCEESPAWVKLTRQDGWQWAAALLPPHHLLSARGTLLGHFLISVVNRPGERTSPAGAAYADEAHPPAPEAAGHSSSCCAAMLHYR
jgi:hypothetical protein